MLVCEPKFHSWGRCTIALTAWTEMLPFKTFSSTVLKLLPFWSIRTKGHQCWWLTDKNCCRRRGQHRVTLYPCPCMPSVFYPSFAGLQVMMFSRFGMQTTPPLLESWTYCEGGGTNRKCWVRLLVITQIHLKPGSLPRKNVLTWLLILSRILIPKLLRREGVILVHHLAAKNS